MSKEIDVKCEECEKYYKRSRGRYNEAIKKGYRQFCSKKCRSGFFTTKIDQNCKNCNQAIKVQRSDYKSSKTKKFFCSNSCAATHNNKGRKQSSKTREKISKALLKNETPIKECLSCGKNFKANVKSSKCCSIKCGQIYRFGTAPLTKDDLVNLILESHKKNDRTPQKRDFARKIDHAATKFFGT